jgi:hypothetical protein
MSDQFPIPVEIGHASDLQIADQNRSRAWLHSLVSVNGIPSAVIEYPDGYITMLSLYQYRLVSLKPLGPIAAREPAQPAKPE